MKTVISYLIVDDEPLARARVKRLMQKHASFRCIGEIDCADGVEALLKQEPVQLIFLDISMPGQSGVELASQLRLQFPRMKIVFLTAHPEYALEAFELHANGYLVKPLDSDKLDALLTTIFPSMETLSYYVGSELRYVQVSDVIVAEADEKYTRVTLNSSQQALIDMSLKSLLDKFPTHFIQIHRRTLVKRTEISALELHEQKHYVYLKSLSNRYEVSRRAYTQIKTLF